MSVDIIEASSVNGLPFSLKLFVAFVIPLTLTTCVMWPVNRFLPALPEPDYRKFLVVVAGALLFIRPIAPGQITIVLLEMAFLGAMIVWLVVRPGVGPAVLLLLYAAGKLVLTLGLIFGGTLGSVKIAFFLGQSILCVGIVLWAIVALKFHGSQTSGTSSERATPPDAAN